MFSPFVSPNFSLQLQNQIRANFQPQFNHYQPHMVQSHNHQGEQYQYQNFQNVTYEIQNTSFHSNHQEECHEFTRKSTFFEGPHFGSQTFISHMKKNVQRSCQDSPNSKQNPQKMHTQTKNQTNIFELQTFEVPQYQKPQQIVSNQKQMIQPQQNEAILQEFDQKDNEQISQTQRLFEMFDNEELQSKHMQNHHQSNHIPSTIQEQNQSESFYKIYEESIGEESIVGEEDESKVQNPPKISFLKQISSKIKNSRVQFQKSDSNKFSLRQFNQTVKKAKQISQTPKSQTFQTQNLCRVILDLLKKKEEPLRREPYEMQTLVQKLKLSILPHFQKLENDYTDKITQMNQLIRGMLMLNVNKGKQDEKQENPPKKFEGRLFNVTQSAIRININDDEGSDNKSYSQSKEGLQQIEQENERKQDRSMIQVPIITRTDSSDGIFVSYRSGVSDVDILGSINSQVEPINISTDGPIESDDI